MIRLAYPAAALLLASGGPTTAGSDAPCTRELVVLGAGQDAGAPQIGNAADEGPELWPSSLALIDREHEQRFLFDATPAITGQLAMLDRIEPPRLDREIDGVFLTHAHMGHYLGLAWFGREAAGALGIPVLAMPRMAEFLRKNGPWSQLVELQNVMITEMAESEFTVVSDDFSVMPILVPHRDEFSETVGFVIMTSGKHALYLPDLDSWDEFEEMTGQSLEDLLAAVDHAFVDATFWDDNELPGRDMGEIPHPRVKATMDRLAGLPSEQRGKLRFIHYNHTNPIRDPASAESREVEQRGFTVARRGDRICLD